MAKPFNLADAKAGHPVATSCGRKMKIFDYDYPISGTTDVPVILGTVYKDDNNAFVTYWNQFGNWFGGGPNGVGHLVMAPIGTIDGNPVYPGDMITAYGKTFPVTYDTKIDLVDAKWPRQYPETQMGGKELEGVYMDTNAGGDGYDDHIAVANAAIRHGIDNGYLLDPRDAASVSPLPAGVGFVWERPTEPQPPFAMLYKLAQHLNLDLSQTFSMIVDRLKSRERALVWKGIRESEIRNGIAPQEWRFDDVDALIAKVK